MSQLRLVRAGLAALLIAPLLGVATAAGHETTPTQEPAPAASATAATTALVRVRVTTTSDWTTVTFSGRLGGVQVRSTAGTKQVQRLASGLTLRAVGPDGAFVEFDAVLEDTSSMASWVSTEKGQGGSTRVRVENRTGEPFVALDARNDVRSSTDGTYRKLFTVSRQQLFGTTPLELPRVATDPLVLAFYHPWFNEAVYADTTLADRPVDRSDVWDYDDVLAMTTQARSAGIDGFVSTWAGATNDRVAFGKVLRAARATGGTAAGVLEAVTGNAPRDPDRPADPAVVESWLRELLATAAHPSYLRVDGVPIVFVYEMRRLPRTAWRTILDHLTSDGLGVRLVGDAGPAWAGVTWGDYDYGPWGDDQGFHPTASIAGQFATMAFEARSYAATHPAGGPRLMAATVYPGYDDRRLRGDDRPHVDREGTATYRALWDAARSVDPDWVLITSWNEWWEGTSIQPGERFGSGALDATAGLAAAFKQGQTSS